MDKLQYPVDNVWFSRGFTSSHRGVDIGWFTKYGQNMPVYAPGGGKVVAAVDGYSNSYSSGVPTWGNYVKIYHGNNDAGKPVYTLQAHMLKGSVCVKVGQTVTRGQQIGRMNNSGYSAGSHDHSEVYVGGAGTSYRVNPADWLYIYPHQYIDPDTQKKYGVQTYDPVEYFGAPDGEDRTVNQVHVTYEQLRARREPNGEILGYINRGYYDIGEQQVRGGYVWDMVNGKYWIAEVDGCSEFIPGGTAAVPGIDVSEYQNDIDWAKVKAAGYSFAIIRCGFRGYETGRLVSDKMFEKHYAGAHAVGLDIGVYLLSQAITPEEAAAEAEFAMKLCDGKAISYPIYIDSELGNGTGTGRADKLKKNERTAVCKAFCDAVRSKGYIPGVYASLSWYNAQLDVAQLKSYELWVAHYTDAEHPEYRATFGIWQHTSTGNVPGVDGHADLNRCYRDYPADQPEPEPTVQLYDFAAYAMTKGDANTLKATADGLGLRNEVVLSK